MSSGVGVIFQNSQNSLSGNATTTIPYIEMVEKSRARQLSGRVPGGQNYLGNSASNGTIYVGTTTVNGNILLADEMVTGLADLGYAKNLAWLLTLNATAAATLNLGAAPSTNATTVGVNAIQLVTDNGATAYSSVVNANLIMVYNLDPVNSLTYGPVTNGILVTPANNTINVPPASRAVFEQTGNGYTMAAAHTNLVFTGNGGNVIVILAGS